MIPHRRSVLRLCSLLALVVTAVVVMLLPGSVSCPDTEGIDPLECTHTAASPLRIAAVVVGLLVAGIFWVAATIRDLG